MNKKHVLLADADSRALGEFQQALGEQWEIIYARNGADALAMLDQQPCEVAIANLELPEIDGAELLNRIRRKYPKTVRFIAARDVDKERVVKTARGAHQFLTKPYDPAAVRDAIERALAFDGWVPSEQMRETIARVRTLPTIPTLYVEVLAALRSPDVTTDQVGAIIAKDMAMMTKMLQLLNSACFGLTREITDPAEAVGILGFETVKSMVMTIKLLNQYDKLRVSDFSIDALWRHSTDVARTARQLTLFETGDRALADTAFTAGLLHDLGKVVLAANFEDKYSGALLLGFKQNMTAWEVEKEIFGVNHGEIGAYLLGLWGMPLNILEATALHHEPSRSTNKAFSPLTAVHVANVLEREISPDELGMISPKLDGAHLEELGLLGRVQAWRGAVSTRDGVTVEPGHPVEYSEPEPEVETQTTSLAEASPGSTQVWDTPEPVAASSGSKTKWVVACAGAVMLLLVGWFAFQIPASKPQPVAQTKTTPNLNPTSDKSALATAHTANAPANVAAADKSHDKPSVAVAPADLPLVSPIIVRARSTTPDAPAAALKPNPFSEFKLQGILFSTDAPSAIVNGKTVGINDHVHGALVVGITASSVTLEIQGERKTLSIK